MNPVDTILLGDVREIARTLPDNYVQTIVTSPPYYNLRDYQTGEWHGGAADCDHSPKREKSIASSTLQGGKKTTDSAQAAFRDVCGKCGAVREDLQIGLETTPEEYVQTLVEVFRELRRVLREDGTVWLNLGDSYASSGGPEPAQSKWQVDGASNGQNGGNSRNSGNLKPKDLMMIPARVALALQADGWYLRSEIVWHKTNGLPESVKDRPTRSHEMIYLLSKSPQYYYDQDAIREPIKTESILRQMRAVGEDHKNANGAPGQTPHTMAQPRPNRNNSTTFKRNGSKREQVIPGQSKGTHREDRDDTGYHPLGRNKRDVWTTSVGGYEGTHFAVFPSDLIRPCILAGCPKRICSECKHGKSSVLNTGFLDEKITTGFEPSCDCNADHVPGIVLDPFIGSGTVAEVCIEEGRHFLGIELNPGYIALAEKRIADVRNRLLAGKEYVKKTTQVESGYQQTGLFDEQ